MGGNPLRPLRLDFESGLVIGNPVMPPEEQSGLYAARKLNLGSRHEDSIYFVAWDDYFGFGLYDLYQLLREVINREKEDS